MASVHWLFEINSNYYSTKDVTWSSTSYSAKILPDSFNRVQSGYNLGGHLITPGEFEFKFSDPSGAESKSSFEGKDLILRLIVDGTEKRTWKFRINWAVFAYGAWTVHCVDLLQKALQGTWPNTRHPKEVWPSSDSDPEDLNDYCVPIIFGTAYIPIMSVNVGGTRYYVLGADTSPTYTVSEVTSPRRWPGMSVWDDSYSYPKSTDSGHQLCQLIIHDSDGDGAADANGVWPSGDECLSPLIKFSRSDTSGMTNPADWIEYILKDMGIDSGDIDTGTGSTFSTAASTYIDRGISWNGGFWKKEDREKLLSELLRALDSYIIVSDKIELHTFSKTSQETITTSTVKKDTYSPSALTKSDHDGGRVAWVNSGYPQDRLTGKSVVPLYSSQSTIDKPSDDVLKCRFSSDSQNAKDAATLHFAKKFLQQDRVSFDSQYSKLTNFSSLTAAQVVTVNDSQFGGSFDVIIEAISFNKDLSVSFEGVSLEYLEDWSDIGSTAVTITEDSTSGSWEVVETDGEGNVDNPAPWSKVVDDDGHRPEDDADVTADNPQYWEWIKGSKPEKYADNTSDHALDIHHTGNSAPSSPKTGWLWHDTSTSPDELKRYDGESWNKIATLEASWSQIVNDNDGKPDDNADVTKTIIDGGLITTGSIQGSDYDSSNGLKIDFNTAEIIVNEAAGLLVQSTGGVKIDGGDLNVVDGGNITIFGSGYDNLGKLLLKNAGDDSDWIEIFVGDYFSNYIVPTDIYGQNLHFGASDYNASNSSIGESRFFWNFDVNSKYINFIPNSEEGVFIDFSGIWAYHYHPDQQSEMDIGKSYDSKKRFNNVYINGRIEAGGHPLVRVAMSADETNLPNDGSDTKLPFDTEDDDHTNDFNTSTYTYTAAFDQTLKVDFWVQLKNIDIDAEYTIIVKTTDIEYPVSFNIDGFSSDVSNWSFAGSVVVDLDENDTLYIKIRQNGGASQTDVDHQFRRTYLCLSYFNKKA